MVNFPSTNGQLDQSIRYVMSTGQLEFSRSYPLDFQYYAATQNTRLRLCQDAGGQTCIWTTPALIAGKETGTNRQWHAASATLPPGKYAVVENKQFRILPAELDRRL